MRPRVISPIAALFTVESVEFALVSVELWPREVVVRLAGRLTEGTKQLVEEHLSRVETWARTRTDADAINPPIEPVERLLATLTLTLFDDANTEYRLRSAQRGGTGSEWRSDWFFVPGPNDFASTLWIRGRVQESDFEYAVDIVDAKRTKVR